jgi:hypothetical protein
MAWRACASLYRECISYTDRAVRLSLERARDRPLLADSVEKVENRGAPKISQMSIFGLLRRYVAF